MARWMLKTLEKKNVEEITTWSKGDLTITRTEWFRWGEWMVDQPDRPEVDTDNADGYDVYGSGIDWELVDMVDGVSLWWGFPGSVDEEEQERIRELFDEEGYQGMEDDGWEHMDTEIILHGPLAVESA